LIIETWLVTPEESKKHFTIPPDCSYKLGFFCSFLKRVSTELSKLIYRLSEPRRLLQKLKFKKRSKKQKNKCPFFALWYRYSWNFYDKTENNS